jgi:hypothetical protein
MPPTKQPVRKDLKVPETPKKGKGGVSKRTPVKGAPTKEAGSTAERDLLFLWNVSRLGGGITVSIIYSQRDHTSNAHDTK